jgi:transposase
LREKILARRRYEYWQISVELARNYHTCVLEKFNLSRMQRKKLAESEEAEILRVKYNQRIAACSELRNILVHAFLCRAGDARGIDPAMTTQRCSVCGCEERWDAAPRIDHKCPQCGCKWDQDYNAAINIMRLYRAGDDEPYQTKRPPRFHQRHKNYTPPENDGPENRPST